MNMRLRYFVVKREPTTYCGLNLVDTPDVDISVRQVQPDVPGRFASAVQVLVCCGQLPTQTLIVVLLSLAGMTPPSNDQIPLRFFAALTLIDTAVVTFMMWTFLRASNESPRAVFFGARNLKKEILLGLASVPAVLVGTGLLVGVLRLAVPALHNVKISPFDSFTDSALKTIVFLTCAIVAGGVREELQRGFLLHRFEQKLGGMWVGLVLYSLVFGLGHAMQGWDIALATGSLGFFWGYLYIRRRSVAAAMVSHAGFNASEVLIQLLAKTLGIKP
ncbi:MAG: CPBP family intramembrane metalloprotease [Acidobacteria bacterium]|nr:MAG: CPBP family intramembrane metalloprotease [Acidobacteriota bacterium]